MQHDRIRQAIARIEAAAETIARRAPADAALRREAETALAELDRLIAGLEG